jgi:hypothetical protein
MYKYSGSHSDGTGVLYTKILYHCHIRIPESRSFKEIQHQSVLPVARPSHQVNTSRVIHSKFMRKTKPKSSSWAGRVCLLSETSLKSEYVRSYKQTFSIKSKAFASAIMLR